jgi:hypothetical protein
MQSRVPKGFSKIFVKETIFLIYAFVYTQETLKNWGLKGVKV